jgi:hypothetical protein
VQFRKDAQSTMNAIFRNVIVKSKFKENDTRFKKGRKDKEQMVVGSPNYWRNRPKNYSYLTGEDVKKRYRKFIGTRKQYYLGFIKKWIIENKNPNTYYLEYFDFIRSPFDHLLKVIRLFGEKVDEELLKKVIKEKEISLKHNIQKDPLYIENFNEEFGLIDVEERYYK